MSKSKLDNMLQISPKKSTVKGLKVQIKDLHEKNKKLYQKINLLKKQNEKYKSQLIFIQNIFIFAILAAISSDVIFETYYLYDTIKYFGYSTLIISFSVALSIISIFSTHF